MRNLKFTVGTEVKIKGTSIYGKVIRIEKDPEKMEWEFKSHPKFILVEANGLAAFYSPSKLRRIGSYYPNKDHGNE